MLNVYPAQTTQVIDTTHKNTHDGIYFSGGYYNASVASAGTINVLIQTTADYFWHMKAHIAAGADATVLIYEDTTFSAAGTAITMSNHNRSSGKVFPHTITHTPTVIAVGTQINGTEFVPGGGVLLSSGGDMNFSNEFILAKSKNYLIRVTNISGGATPLSINLQGYVPTL